MWQGIVKSEIKKIEGDLEYIRARLIDPIAIKKVDEILTKIRLLSNVINKIDVRSLLERLR